MIRTNQLPVSAASGGFSNRRHFQQRSGRTGISEGKRSRPCHRGYLYARHEWHRTASLDSGRSPEPLGHYGDGEIQTVAEALQLGIVDYLIKPFSFARFQEAVQKYLRKEDVLKHSHTANQTMLDQLLNAAPANLNFETQDLRKGLNQMTLDRVKSYLRERPDEKHTCESLSAALGLSKVTIRRYLNYLIEIQEMVSSIDYETGGRPRVLYLLKR